MQITVPIPSFRVIAVAAGVIFLFVGVWGLVEFQPRRQLERANDRLMAAIERRDWKRVVPMISEDYQDAWGFDRQNAVSVGVELLQHFFGLGITRENESIEVRGDTGTVRARIRLVGNGTGIAQAVLAEANRLEEPFTVTWRREGWQPWSWRVVSVAQPELARRHYPL